MIAIIISKMRKTLLVLNLLALVASIFWLALEKTFEPLISTLGLIATLLTLIFSNNENGDKTIMKQKGGKNSRNYQSKGDINL